MKEVLIGLAFSLAYLYTFWLLYVLVMGLYRAHLSGRLRGIAFALALPPVAVGYAVDLFANWTFAALWFREWPRSVDELVTDRLTRYSSGLPGWRQRHAEWVCSNLLDYFDPHERHCR